MKSVLIAVAMLAALSPVVTALAQNQLPTTTVTAPKPKPKPKPAVVHPQVSRASITNNDSVLPDRPDPETPHVRSRDWNAPGAINLHYMTDAQFAAFQAAHPTAVFFGRCYTGQDPDENIRAKLRAHTIMCP